MDLGAVIERIIMEYAGIPYAYEPDLVQIPVFDREHGHYLLIVAGWGGRRRTGPLLPDPYCRLQ